MSILLPNNNTPDFIIKSTMAFSIIVVIALSPFVVNHLIHNNYLLFFLNISIILCAFINAYLCYKRLFIPFINIFIVAPLVTITVASNIYILGSPTTYWAVLGAITFYFIIEKKYAWIVNCIYMLIIIPIGCFKLNFDQAIRYSAVIISSSFFVFSSLHEINKLHYLLKHGSSTDPLTGVLNRETLASSIQRAMLLFKRRNIPSTLVLFDIDHFKIINDTYGHDMGDKVLTDIGHLLKTSLNIEHSVFRLGGEEFLVLCNNTNIEKGIAIAELLRNKIMLTNSIPEHTVTASFGVTTLTNQTDWKEWLKQADHLLYQAKADGRNITKS